MIYTVTGVVDPYDAGYLATRCFGVFQTLDEAMESVVNNYSDIWEHTYNFMVIEPLEFGIHPYSASEDQMWFEYNQKTDRFDFIPSFFLGKECNLHGIG